MNSCRHPDHPHCTRWVLPGASTCMGGHAQPARDGHKAADFRADSAASGHRAGSDGRVDGTDSVDEVNRAASADRFAHAGGIDTAGTTPPQRAPDSAAGPVRAEPAEIRPVLHVSGYDPRAAGGRQALRLDLRGMPDDAPDIAVHLRSALLPGGGARQVFFRALHGKWTPCFVEFSARGREHGQHRIDVELVARRGGRTERRWACTLVVLVPRPDATLADIQQAFLSTHRKVRVSADDASIARLHAVPAAGRLDIDVEASNGSIAQLDIDPARGKIDLGLATISWDEELVEIGSAAAHPQPGHAACLLNPAGQPQVPRHVRLFAFDECVLGRLDPTAPDADVLLAHYTGDGPDPSGLTRRLSARHAVLRPGPQGFEVEDISRYGLLVDGAWPGKNVAVPLRLGMRLDMTASVRGVVSLQVSAVMPHAVILHRLDDGAHDECLYIVAPNRHPGVPGAPQPALARAASLPFIFHAEGGFWHMDPASGRETPLAPGVRLDGLQGMPEGAGFAASPYPPDDACPDPLPWHCRRATDARPPRPARPA